MNPVSHPRALCRILRRANMFPWSEGLAIAFAGLALFTSPSLSTPADGAGVLPAPSPLLESASPAAAELPMSWSSILSVVVTPGALAPGDALNKEASVEAAVQHGRLRSMLVDLGALSVVRSFPGADALLRSRPGMPDLARFHHIRFASAEHALQAASLLADDPAVLVVQPIPDDIALPASGDDPYLAASWWFHEDSQWPLLNRGLRPATERCGRAVAGSDLRIVPVWRKYFLDAHPQSAGRIGSPWVVIGFVDQGIFDDHPEMRVLKEFSGDPRVTFCPGRDWFGSHGTKMSGLAAMRALDGRGAAGVCGDCSVLDISAPSCPCSEGDDRTRSCDTLHPLWYTKVVSTLLVPLGTDEDGASRHLLVINASLAARNYAPLEEIEALWAAHLAGVLVVASSTDHSYDTPQPIEPANIPFVLGVGGHTWADRFWDASVSCYAGTNGTTVGQDVVDLTAPASGAMLSAFPWELHAGAGPYAWTSGQCSAATALVSGTAGLLQSYAVSGSPLGRALDPDDLAGILTATTRPYAADPTVNATCASSLCPRSYYGTGMASAENAFFALSRANQWQERFVGLSDGCTIQGVEPLIVDGEGRTWREYHVRWDFTLAPRPAETEAPADLPRYVAWPLRARSTSLCGYGPSPDRILVAQSGIRDCAVTLDRATGRGTLTGTNFALIERGVETPLVPWDEFRMGMAFWSDPNLHAFGDAASSHGATTTLDLQVLGPNPFREAIDLRYVADAAGTATIEVIDVGGRVITTLRSGVLPERPLVLQWAGRDATGSPVPAGIYWVRVRSQGTSVVRPVVLVR